jgi:hypothetical protein
MSRAGQTPHGARPNRKGVRDLGLGHVPARCVKPSGRSLEPRSNARPRGMAVPQEQSCGQNSAYRSGCQQTFPFDHFQTQQNRCDAGVTRLTAVATFLFFLGYAQAGEIRGCRCARDMVPFPRGRLRLRPKCCLGRTNHEGYLAALCPRARHSLDHHSMLSSPARQRR